MQMTGGEALSALERRLLPHRATAGEQAEWSKYAFETLPPAMDPGREALIHQGFDAGYSAAMRVILSELAEVQNVALRSR